MPEKWVLRQYQCLPLRAKVSMSQNRIREWYNHFDGSVYVSFSGGKDSTVLAHLVHELYPDVPLVFANTGLEYPEIQAFAKKMGAEFIRPKMSFSEVISIYGYPLISKENAEAIYYARCIRNGGVQRSANAMNSTVPDSWMTPKISPGGANTFGRSISGHSSPEAISRIGMEEQGRRTAGGQTLQTHAAPGSKSGGGYSRNQSEGTSSWAGTEETEPG